MKFTAAILVAVITFVLAACAPHVHAEYPRYRTGDDLAAASTDILQVTIVSSRVAALESKPFTGTDPETNPYHGTATERPESITVDVVIHEATVDETFKGPEQRGGTVEIAQMRDDADDVPLKEDETYVLYLRNVDPNLPAGIVAGPQGQYLLSGGRLTPASPERSLELTRDQLRSI